MGQLTKKPKHVNVDHKIVTYEVPVYICPTCMVEHQGSGIHRRIVRFYCSCGQELIIDNCHRPVKK